MKSSVDMRSHYEIAHTDKGQEGGRNRAYPVCLAVPDEVSTCSPEDYRRKYLVSYADIFQRVEKSTLQQTKARMKIGMLTRRRFATGF